MYHIDDANFINTIIASTSVTLQELIIEGNGTDHNSDLYAINTDSGNHYLYYTDNPKIFLPVNIGGNSSTLVVENVYIGYVASSNLVFGEESIFDGWSLVISNNANAYSTLVGSDGEEILFGGFVNDTLIGEGDDDILLGNGGNDVLKGGTGYNIIDGGSGNDTISYDDISLGSRDIDIDLSTNSAINIGTALFDTQDLIYNVENVIGSKGDDVIRFCRVC